MKNEKGILTIMDKIKAATELLNTVKDYVEILKVNPKLKQTFNKDVIAEQIAVNETEIVNLVNYLTQK